MKPFLLRLLVIFVASTACSFPAAALSTWSSPIQDLNTSNIGGGSTQRPTIASVVFNNQIFIAYTSSDDCDGIGCAIRIRNNAGQGPDGGFSFTDFGILGVPTIGQVFSKVNPAMGVQNGIVYIAWTDEANNNWLSMSTNMINWSAPVTILQGTLVPTIESIDISFNPATPNQLSLGYVGTTKFPTFCRVLPNASNFPASSVTCNTSTNSSTRMLYNPGLIWINNISFMFATSQASSHCIISFFSGSASDPWASWDPGSLCNKQQTSSAPDPVLYNGSLYVAFRSNDSSAAFDLIGGTVSTNPNPPSYNWARVSTGGQHMDGSPDLLPVSTSQGLILLFPTELVNFYVRGNSLFSVHAQ